MTRDISWWSEELKLYNAMVVCLCCAWTFVQGGHVRVDLVYAGVSYRTKRVIDMVGSLLFMMSFAVLVWMYGWFFLWRHLVTPKVSASDKLDQMMMKARAFRWNVETIGFSPSGFNGYFLFKVLLVAFAGMVFLQAVAFFYRSYLEWKEGPASEGRYLDRDVLDPGEIEFAGPQRLAD
jgi:TRAP-type C4-dicarboxylate transport system permease small subunit